MAERIEVRPPASSSRIRPRMGNCRDDADCPRGQFCAFDIFDHVACSGHECARDEECRTGFVCRMTWNRTGGRGPRRCILAGKRKEGERCVDLPQSTSEACEPELRCNQLFCGRPCRIDDPSTCPAGYACRKGVDGASCLPSCQEGDCPFGETCVSFRTFSFCAVVTGENCQERPCPAGQECRRVFAGRSKEMAMGCFFPCDDEKSCPKDLICHFGMCEPRCHMSLDTPCPPATKCTLVDWDRSLSTCSLSP